MTLLSINVVSVAQRLEAVLRGIRPIPEYIEPDRESFSMGLGHFDPQHKHLRKPA